MGAVKEQSANLYATKMAERGFVTLSLDLSFWGRSDGYPRNAVSPDIYAEDFSAAIDFLGTRPFLDGNRIGAIGICGSGSFVISAAKLDPRMKAIATVSMYDMGAANRNGLRNSQTLEQRKKSIAEAAEQRYAEFMGGKAKYTSGTVQAINENSSAIPVGVSSIRSLVLAGSGRRVHWTTSRLGDGSFRPRAEDIKPKARRSTTTQETTVDLRVHCGR